jgi:uncharacterized protein (TIGR02172 family)
MSNVNGSFDGNVLTIGLSGHIDSSNSEAAEADILALRNKHKDGSIILDLKGLEYISSAGLRVILRLSKSEPTLRLIDISPSVYEVFEMTGFVEMIPCEKAYRELSVEGCEVIGQGSNGKVYRLDPDTIIKVYLNPNALPEIHRERELARKAFVLGIPTAIPYDVVRVGSGYGSVFELLNAKSFSKLINEDPSKLDYYCDLYVDLLKKIHATAVAPGDMPDMKAVAVDWAKYLIGHLPDEESAKLIKMIEAVPEVHKMMHGDYHTKNVLMQKGEVLLIDMDTLCYGHPIFEFASMYNGFIGFGELDHSQSESFMGMPYEVATKFFYHAMRKYLGTDDEAKVQEVVDKARIVGYARIMRRTIKRLGEDTPEGKPMADNCKKRLHELLAKYDTLVF